jgi:hypothetical protein
MKYLALITALAASPAMAQGTCMPHDHMTVFLADRYEETRQMVALDVQGNMVEIWASEGGSWTITVTAPNGPTCALAGGQNFELVADPMPPLGEEG